jgi:hypothetical protein
MAILVFVGADDVWLTVDSAFSTSRNHAVHIVVTAIIGQNLICLPKASLLGQTPA